MVDLKTDLSLRPFFDDFKVDNGAESKNYHRILFRPATAVQARELNQLQAILQEQVARNSRYLFKDGSIIDGCPITYRNKFDFVRVADTFGTNTSRQLSTIPAGMLITNSLENTPSSIGAVRAEVVLSKDGYFLQYPDTNVFYIDYIASGRDENDNQLDKFRSGDTLYIFGSGQSKLGTLDANNVIDTISVITSNATHEAIGQGYGMRVGDGVIFQKGHLVNVDAQTIVVSKYTTNPNTYVVGFQTEEKIITPEADTSLFDNALGYPNEKAPGAHRLKLIPVLTAYKRSEIANDKNFFAIVEFDSNQPTEKNVGEETLNRLLDVIAKRTSEESGNYTVKPFSVELMPISANTSHFNYDVSPGIIYVNGYRKEKGPGTISTAAKKADTFKLSNAQTISTSFGNYVLVNEALGVFDFDKLSLVDLYDDSQKSISQNEGVLAGTTGNKIGTARVAGFQHDSGNKGSSDCTYRLYLFDVVMNTNKSFANVKSFVTTTGAYGNARADAVQVNGQTQLVDAGMARLVFPTGLNAVKTLRDSQSVPDSQFVFRDIVSATMNTAGVVTFKINLAANGGKERLVDSIGQISGGRELLYNIVLTQAAYTTNLGSLNLVADPLDSTIWIATGTTTQFTKQFVPGDLVNISTAYDGTKTVKVVSIDNDLRMRVEKGNVAVGSNINFRKFYPAGHVVNLSQFGGTIVVNAAQDEFTVTTNLNLGGTLNSTQTVYAEYPVQRTEAYESKKEIKKNRFVAIDCSSNAGGLTGPWYLGFSDIAKVRNVYVGTTYSSTNPDRTAWFSYDNGQTDYSYDHGFLYVKPQYKGNITSSTRILVELDYFVANTTSGVGFFSVDSYPVDDANYETDVTKIHTAEIPVYFSKILNSSIDLRNAIDFRPRITNTAVDAMDQSAATINPLRSTTYDVHAKGQFLPDPDTVFQCDIQYYLPRVDLLCMNKEGDIIIRSGEPDLVPLEPKNELDTSVFARIDVKPYPTIGTREAVSFNRKDLASRVQARIIKRYTMEDIGNLEKRISRMEYYATLNMLEQQAKDMVIPDASGLDRFKNGIFADTFNSHLLGKVTDFEYNIAIDKDKSLARPPFETYDIDTQFNSSLSSGIQKTGYLLTLPYTSDVYINQLFASKFRNACESIYQWNGKIDLYPAYDHFRDEDLAPAVNIPLDLSAPWEDFANSPFASNFGDWRTTDVDRDRETRGNRVTTTTSTTQERNIQNLNVNTTTDNVKLGDFVTDVSISPFIRARTVAFVVKGLKPNTRMYPFFDSVNVSEFCAPGVLSNLTNVESGKEDRIVTKTGNWNSELVTDSNGNLYGVFNIPSNKFRTGDREFVVSNVDSLITGADAQISKAVAQYTASSLSVTKQPTTLQTTNPVISVSTETQKRVTEETRTRTVQKDPIAQSFSVVVPESASGAFITQIGLFFQSKSTSLGCSVFIMELTNGYPNSQSILGQSHLTSANINTSTNGSVETIFKFDSPIFLNNMTDYCFMVVPDGSNPDYNLWVSEVGGIDILTSQQISSAPYTGIMFVSANMNAWTAIQKEDIKFKVYRANFLSSEGYATFENESDDFLTVDGFTKQTSGVSPRVGDVVVKLTGQNGSIITNPTNTAYSFGFVQYLNEADSTLFVDSSVGNFKANDYIEIHRPTGSPNDLSSLSSATRISSSKIVSVDNIEYHAVVPRFTTLEPAQTSVNFGFKGTSSSGVADSEFVGIKNDYEKEDFSVLHSAFSKSNESSKTTFFKATLRSNSSYVSPVLDLRRKSSLLIKNMINNDATNEHTRHGNAKTKYISLNTTLDDKIGNAEDCIVSIGAYRPSGSDIKVYIKAYGSDDNDNFDEKLWTEMPMSEGGINTFSSPFDTSDYREYDFSMPSYVILNYFEGDGSQTSFTTRGVLGSTAIPNTNILVTVNGVVAIRTTPFAINDYTITSENTIAFTIAPASGAKIEVREYTNITEDSGRTTVYLNDGIAEYRRKDGGLVKGFKTYCFKIVLLSDSGNRVPRLADFRSISLQK